MKYASHGKIDNDGRIFSDEVLTEKEGYQAMMYMLEAFFQSSGSRDLTDILSGGSLASDGTVIDTVYWEYWLEAVQKVKSESSKEIKNG